jgi:hypothetical protein
MPAQLNDADLDTWLCQLVHDDWLQTKPFIPLPIMGIPTWCAENENPDFYADKNVFRT